MQELVLWLALVRVVSRWLTHPRPVPHELPPVAANVGGFHPPRRPSPNGDVLVLDTHTAPPASIEFRA